MTSRAAFLALLLLLPAGCERREEPVSREEIADSLARGLIAPGYDSFAAACAALSAAAATFEAAPASGTLAALQQAWRHARRAWGLVEGHFFGPEDDLLLQAKIDTAPVIESALDAILAGSDVLNALYVEALGSNRKGFIAIEYLLFDAGGDNVAQLALLTGAADGVRRRAFIRALADNLRDVAAQISTLWAPSGGDFTGKFARPGSAGSPYPGVKEALDDLINRMIFFTEFTADTRLGRPLGLVGGGGGVPDPAAVEARRSDSSREDLIADLEGLQALYRGAPGGLGLSAQVVLIGEALDAGLRRSFETALTDVRAIPEPLEAAVIAADPRVTQAYASVKELKTRLAVDLVSAFGSTLTFSPYDGD